MMEIYNIFKPIVNLFFALVEAVMFLRFILKLFGAQASIAFVNFIYDVSDVLISPFGKIFPDMNIGGRFLIEFNTLFVWVLYIIIHWIIIEILRFFKRSAASRYQQQQ